MVNERDREADLERQEDALLRQHHCVGKTHGIYTESQMNCQQRQREESPLDEEHTRTASQTYLEGVLWHSLQLSLHRHHCPPRAMCCCKWWLMGHTIKQIAAMPDIGCTDRGTVSKDVKAALTILRADGSIGLYEVLCEVFQLRMAILRDMLK